MSFVFKVDEDCRIADADSRLVLVRAAIARLQEIEAALTLSVECKTAIDSLAPMFPASISNLPPEILAEVFTHTLAPCPYVEPSVSCSPIVLVRVCRRWRDVALATPRLWSSLHVSLSKVYQSCWTGYSHWLMRAKAAPTSLRILCDVDPTSLDPTQHTQLSSRLEPLISRCSNVCLHGIPIDGLLSHVPKLTHLELSGSQRNVARTSFAVSNIVPRLTSASLHFMAYEVDDHQSLARFQLPWMQLTDLRVHFILLSSTMFLTIIGMCPSLTVLCASCVSTTDDVELGRHVHRHGGLDECISHPTLRHLEMKVLRPRLDVLFSALELPALRILDLSFCLRERDIWPHEEFAAFVRRSECTLDTLTIRQNKTAHPFKEAYERLLCKHVVMLPPA
ncbi:hypothetical protein CONPUDRAFT_145722 [Coniophora puteana RWD-64-598 SS2]|uniref:Uncharacterized protein n=1 Tax=Coniophora puteana (strain RWD-64-598) TaxID=741705 RepID=A0A5M3MIQ4_CONPW|nr:uncharacterized protein CONPUDRAFT_145722 [Coniophora puteana RWD-64-598 SS2]EIW78525.1 hypothetical protein CONPUDRAFT_145722 [Coniophora puteana RWD-64-598 SS2]